MAAKNGESPIQKVLSSPKIEPPPKTLDEARNAPGRAEKIAEIADLIEKEGIEYVFFQQVSISGHINGKGVVADWFPEVATKGYQLVYGATADLFTDRQENYIGFGPEESELAAMADLDTFTRLPCNRRAQVATHAVEYAVESVPRRSRVMLSPGPMPRRPRRWTWLPSLLETLATGWFQPTAGRGPGSGEEGRT